MLRALISACFLAVLPSGPVLADDQQAFEDRVRAYLLEHPEVILEALTLLSERESKAATKARLAEFPELFTDGPRLGIGAPDAPITVIEFFDYKCVPCKAVHPALVDFVAKHPEVRIEMRHLPILAPGSERAARFALATRKVAGEATYYAVHEALWDIRGPLNNAGFQRLAEEMGLDFEKIVSLMESDAISARIAYNRDAAIALEILGTPAFLTPGNVSFGITDIDFLSEAWISQ